jgi:hypothetical protein
MKTFFAIVLLAIATPAVVRAQVTIPPANGPQVTGPQASAGCGDPKENWDVTTDDKNHPTAAPEPTRAHLYLIQDDSQYIPHPRPTVRFGIDGQWVGATHSNSYFFVSLAPGDHRVCINWQGMAGAGGNGRHSESVQSFTAEAGQDYYFSAHDVFTGDPNGHNNEPPFVVFKPLDSDEGLMLMSRFAYATSTPKK